MTKKILIDCDPGIDDALAIALAHGSTEVDVVGLTTVSGNVDLDNTTNNALSLIDFYGMETPVARGSQRPLVRPKHTVSDAHGATGLGDTCLPPGKGNPVREHAVDFIIDSLASSPGEISLIAVGPLTNIALALRKEPRITDWAAEFVMMGGSYSRGNNTPAAEFNVGADPEAAAVVFEAPWRTVMVGLDLTLRARATAPVRGRFAELGRLDTELLTPCLDFYARHWQYQAQGPAVHDACAIAYVINPRLIGTVSARVDVETQGRFTSGMTVTDFNAPAWQHNAAVATELDEDAFWDLMAEAFARVATGIPEA